MTIEIKGSCSIFFKKVPIETIGFSFSKDLHVSLGLKETRCHNVFHLSDQTTSYNAAMIGKTQLKDEVVKVVFQIWIILFWPPNNNSRGNNGEFNNEFWQ